MKQRFVIVLIVALLSVVVIAGGCMSNQTKMQEQKAEEDIPVEEEQQTLEENISPYDAIVDAGYQGEAGAKVEGAKRFKTIKEAINSAPFSGSDGYKIFIKNGTYNEHLLIIKPSVILIGESRDQTVITNGLAAGHKKPDGSEWGTAGATVTVSRPHFRAENLTIENSFDYIANMNKPDSDETKVNGAQALALKLGSNSDMAIFKNVKLTSYQDTLLADRGRSYFYDCIIEGAVDFIYGGGQVVFENCDIVSLNRFSDSNNGYITAASTMPENLGFLFIHCRLLKESAEMADHSVNLGRPWHNSPNVVFIDTYMDSHITETGWVSMGDLTPEDARFFEFNSSGPGALKSETRKVLTEDEAEVYKMESVLGDWHPTAELDQ